MKPFFRVFIFPKNSTEECGADFLNGGELATIVSWIVPGSETPPCIPKLCGPAVRAATPPFSKQHALVTLFGMTDLIGILLLILRSVTFGIDSGQLTVGPIIQVQKGLLAGSRLVPGGRSN